MLLLPKALRAVTPAPTTTSSAARRGAERRMRVVFMVLALGDVAAAQRDECDGQAGEAPDGRGRQAPDERAVEAVLGQQAVPGLEGRGEQHRADGLDAAERP